MANRDPEIPTRRTTLTLPEYLLDEAQELVDAVRFRSLSQVIAVALLDFLIAEGVLEGDDDDDEPDVDDAETTYEDDDDDDPEPFSNLADHDDEDEEDDADDDDDDEEEAA